MIYRDMMWHKTIITYRIPSQLINQASPPVPAVT